jgi:hypothetical protein
MVEAFSPVEPQACEGAERRRRRSGKRDHEQPFLEKDINNFHEIELMHTVCKRTIVRAADALKTLLQYLSDIGLQDERSKLH